MEETQNIAFTQDNIEISQNDLDSKISEAFNSIQQLSEYTKTGFESLNDILYTNILKVSLSSQIVYLQVIINDIGTEKRLRLLELMSFSNIFKRIYYRLNKKSLQKLINKISSEVDEKYKDILSQAQSDVDSTRNLLDQRENFNNHNEQNLQGEQQ